MNCATLRDRYEIVQVNAACCCLWRQLLQTMCWNLRLSESVRGAGKTGRRNRAILWCLIAVTNPLSSNFPSCRSGLSHITAFTMLCPRIPICDVQTCIPYPQIAMSIGKLLINHQNYSKLGQLGDIGRYWDCSHSIFKYIKHDFKKNTYVQCVRCRTLAWGTSWYTWCITGRAPAACTGSCNPNSFKNTIEII